MGRSTDRKNGGEPPPADQATLYWSANCSGEREHTSSDARRTERRSRLSHYQDHCQLGHPEGEPSHQRRAEDTDYARRSEKRAIPAQRLPVVAEGGTRRVSRRLGWRR